MGIQLLEQRPKDPEKFHDVMSYCGSRWISDYYYKRALKYRMEQEDKWWDHDADLEPPHIVVDPITPLARNRAGAPLKSTGLPLSRWVSGCTPTENPTPQGDKKMSSGEKSRIATFLEWTQKLLNFLKGNEGLPTVKVVVASLLLFGTMDVIDAYTKSDFGWNGQEKLIALGIIAATRILSLLITTKHQDAHTRNRDEDHS